MKKPHLFCQIKSNLTHAAIPAALLAILVSPPAFSQSSEESLSFDLNRVNLYLHTHQQDKAEVLLQQLKEKHPKDPQVLAAEAEFLFQNGRTKEAMNSLDKALAIAPHNEDLKARRKEMAGVESTYIFGEREVRITEDTSMEQLWRFKGEAGGDSSLRGGAILENNTIRVDSLVMANGSTARIEDDKQRGEFYLVNRYHNGDSARASLFGADGVLGAGVAYTHVDKYGNTTGQLNYHRPDWEYLETVVEEGTRDELKITRAQRLLPQLEGTLMGSLNRYGIDGDDNVASSHSYELNLTYAVPEQNVERVLGPSSLLEINYNIDAEYPFDVDQRVTGTGLRYEPLPINSREVHNLTAILSKEIDKVNLIGFGGYAYDRLGGDGPLFGGSVSYKPVERLTIEAHASESIRAELTDQKLDIVGMNVKLAF
jgi:tetratricopeptide (TPR) repeat protein